MKIKVQTLDGAAGTADLELDDAMQNVRTRLDCENRIVELEVGSACCAVEGLYLDLHVQPSWPLVSPSAAPLISASL